jgi:hypothetical protein
MWGTDKQQIGVQGDYGNRKRNTLAEYLMRQGQSDKPIQHWTQALANAGSTVLGAYIDKQDTERQNAATGAAEKEADKQFGLGDYLTREPDAPASPAIFGAMASEAPAAPDGSPYAGAIKSIESGGKYDIVGPTHPRYGRALGAYQVMEANLPEWSKAALGREVSADEFLANPKVQDAVFQNRFGGYVQKYGNPQDAASAWFTGRPLAQGANAQDVLGTTGQGYVDKFNRALGQDAQPVQVAQATPSAPSGGSMSPSVRAMARVLQNPYLTPQTRSLGMLILKDKMERAGRDPNESRLRELQVRQAEQNLSTAPLDAEAKRIGVMKGRAELGNMPIEQEGKLLSNAKAARDLNETEYKTDANGNQYERLKGSNEPFRPSPGLPAAQPKVIDELEARKAAAATLGIKPDDPAYKGYVLTGKMPREDAQPLSATDKKAIMEADEGVLAAQTAIQSLQRAKQLSAGASSLPLPGVVNRARAWFGNEAASNTVQMDNEITTNALSQLKSIFGGAPTEGERKLLLDIQGSSSLPHADRVKIFERAERLAQTRLKLNQDRSNELRGGTFYKPQGAQPSQTGTAAAPLPASDPLGIR